MPSALVTGVTGQDGWYLSGLLTADGFDVYGLVTAGDPAPLPDGVRPLLGDMCDTTSLERALDASAPDEVYNLAGVSSVAQSWRMPAVAGDVNGVGAVRLLDALVRSQRNGVSARVVQASSAEIFAGSPPPHDEQSVLAPRTPYGAAKAYAHLAVGVYRRAGLGASSAILYNHESPRRPSQFVSRKITRAVAGIAQGGDEPLVLGNLDSRRDWGHARDYARALTLIARHHRPDDFVVASGVSHSVEDFVRAAFAYVGIDDWRRHVRVDPELVRQTDPEDQRGNPDKARRELGWVPEFSFEQLVEAMVDADLLELSRSS